MYDAHLHWSQKTQSYGHPGWGTKMGMVMQVFLIADSQPVLD